MELYRSGHNGAHSKCVSPPGHEGSNPSVSAHWNRKHDLFYIRVSFFLHFFAISHNFASKVLYFFVIYVYHFLSKNSKISVINL